MAVELSYCVVNTDSRELLLRCLDAIAAEQATLGFRHRGARARQRVGRRLGRRRAQPPRHDRGRRARAPARQGRERLRAAAALARTRLPAAQRGLRAAARRHPHAARRARRAPPGGRRGRAAAPARRPPAAVGVALSHPADRARRRAVPAPPLHGPEPGRAHPHRRLGAVRRAARAPRRRRADRLVRSGLLRLLRRGRLLQAPARRRLAHALRPAGGGDPPRAALDRRGARAAHRRAVAQPRPLHAQAPLAAGRVGACGC